jgi:transposase InsO family protein
MLDAGVPMLFGIGLGTFLRAMLFGSGIGSIRRECLDHFLILSEAHLRRLLRSFRAYYNNSRPHQTLENNSPIPRDVQPPSRGQIRAVPEVCGLHHRYQRVA